MKVIVINEEAHGIIGIALNYYNAVKWLIGNDWIDNNTEVWHEGAQCWEKLKDVQGEDWADAMLEYWDIDDFNDFWAGSFLLEIVPLIGTEEDE